METDVRFVGCVEREKNMWMFLFLLALPVFFFSNFFASHSTIIQSFPNTQLWSPETGRRLWTLTLRCTTQTGSTHSCTSTMTVQRENVRHKHSHSLALLLADSFRFFFFFSGLHTELEHQPFHPQRTQGFAQFNSSLNSAPLLLAALNTPKKAPAYDPSQWYSQGQGSRTPATSLVTQEVDMDSPARRGPSSEAAGSVVDEPDGGERERENVTEEKKPRKFAKGAVTRLNRKRQQSKKEQMRSESDAVRDGDSATPAFTKSEHHYSVHMAAPSLRHSEIPALLLG